MDISLSPWRGEERIGGVSLKRGEQFCNVVNALGVVGHKWRGLCHGVTFGVS